MSNFNIYSNCNLKKTRLSSKSTVKDKQLKKVDIMDKNIKNRLDRISEDGEFNYPGFIEFTEFLNDNYDIALSQIETLKGELNSIKTQATLKNNFTKGITEFVISNFCNSIKKANENLNELEVSIGQEYNKKFAGIFGKSVNGYGVDNEEDLKSVSDSSIINGNESDNGSESSNVYEVDKMKRPRLDNEVKNEKNEIKNFKNEKVSIIAQKNDQNSSAKRKKRSSDSDENDQKEVNTSMERKASKDKKKKNESNKEKNNMGPNILKNQDKESHAFCVNKEQLECKLKEYKIKESHVAIFKLNQDILNKLKVRGSVNCKEIPQDNNNHGSPILIRIRKDILDSNSDDNNNSDAEVKLKSNKKKIGEKRRRFLSNQSDSDKEIEKIIKKRKSKKEKESSDEYDQSEKKADSDTQSSNSDLDKNTKENRNKKKFKRVKRFKDSSESGDSDFEVAKKSKKNIVDSDDQSTNSDGSPQKGRKEIRGLIHKKELAKETKNAEKDEEDRKKRIADFQETYNGLFQEPGSDAIDRFVLDFDPKTKEPIVEVDPLIVAKLKPHQTKGIMFMWKSCFETLEQFKRDPENGGSGGILAHSHPEIKIHIKRALVICPLNTVGNWFKEFSEWLDDQDEYIPIHKLWEGVGPKGKHDIIKGWMKRGGVGIIHYDAFRGLALGSIRASKNLKAEFRKALVDPGPQIIICDEGHLLKNEKSQSSRAVNQIKTNRRIVLTGTPLQNNLLEYHTMMSFVKPNLLGSLKEFRNRFVNPIINGQHKDSTDRDVKIMKRRAHVLHKLLDGSVQRLDYTVLVPYLPPKQEFVIFINLTEIQKQLYKHYIKEIAQVESNADVEERMKERGNFFCDYNTLQKIWTHPYLLTYIKEKELKSDDDEEGSLKDFICDTDASDDELSNKSTTEEDEVDTASVKLKPNLSTRRTRSCKEPESILDEINIEETKALGPPKWWNEFFPEGPESLHRLEISGKILILIDVLRKCIEIGDKLLVFSQYISTLNVIEEFLDEVKLPESRKWEKNKDYFRIDGSVKTESRQKSLDTFNFEAETSKAKLFLISTRAGGLGINVCGANRVVIFDVSWNPSQDLQSIFRVYRFGQKKPSYIYRFISDMSMEEKVYNRQVVKLSLAKRVVDEQQIERHFKFDDMYLMYDFNPEAEREKVTPIFPSNDKLLADVIEGKKELIYNVLEHDSLLENKEDEVLTEEERKAAWEDYQREKSGPAPMNWSTNLQQQQFNNSARQNMQSMQFLQLRNTLQAVHMQKGLNVDEIILNRLANQAHNDAMRLNQLQTVIESGSLKLQPSILQQLILQKLNVEMNLNYLLTYGLPKPQSQNNQQILSYAQQLQAMPNSNVNQQLGRSVSYIQNQPLQQNIKNQHMFPPQLPPSRFNILSRRQPPNLVSAARKNPENTVIDLEEDP